MYDSITVDELFDYLLKDVGKHKDQLLNEIAAGDLPADALNSEILARNNVVTDEVNPDNELDRLDNRDVFGDPYEDPDWLASVVFEQIDDDDAAERVLENIKKGNTTRALQEVHSDEVSSDKGGANKYAEGGDVGNILNVHLDRMLSNIRKDAKLTDDEKKDKALRLIFNMGTRGLNTEPVDIRLDQDDIYNELDRGGLIEGYQSLDPTFMERERITPGKVKDAEAKHVNRRKRLTGYEKWDAASKEVPLSYISDKDGDIQLYTPSKQANTVFNIFTNAFIDAIKAGNAPDMKHLNKYIQDTFEDRMRTMSYSDWEKEIAQMRHPEVNIATLRDLINRTEDPRKVDMPDDELSQYIVTKAREIIKQYKNQGFEVDDKFKDSIIKSILAANDYEDLPEDLLTPEDYTEFIPEFEMPEGETEEERDARIVAEAKAKEDARNDRKLNRWHKGDKEEYKEYLAAKAATVTPRNRFEAMINKGAKKDALRSIYKYVLVRYPLIMKQMQVAKTQGNDKLFHEIYPTAQMYHDILDFKNTPNGRAYLYNWADVLLNNRMLNDFGIENREYSSYDNTLNDILKESKMLMEDEPQTKFEEQAFEALKAADQKHKELQSEENTVFRRGKNRGLDEKLLSTLPTSMADNIRHSMEDN